MLTGIRQVCVGVYRYKTGVGRLKEIFTGINSCRQIEKDINKYETGVD